MRGWRAECVADASAYAIEDLGINLPGSSEGSLGWWHCPGDRDLMNIPTSGVVVGQTNPSQIGWFIDMNAPGAYRLILNDGFVPPVAEYALLPSVDAFVVVTFKQLGSDSYRVRIYVNTQLELEVVETFPSGLSAGGTDVVWGARLDGSGDPIDRISVGSLGRPMYWSTELTQAEVGTAYADHQPQATVVPTPDVDIWLGDGVGDSSTIAVCQEGSGVTFELIGDWSGGGFTMWRPLRRVGTLFDLSGPSTTGWNGVNNAVTTGVDGPIFTGTSTDLLGGATYDWPCYDRHFRIEADIRVPLIGSDLIGIGRRSITTGKGSVFGFVNLGALASSLFVADNDYAEVLRSNVPEGSGTIPAASGDQSDILPGTPANGDVFRFAFEQNGNQLTLVVRKIGEKPLRLVFDLDHRVDENDVGWNPGSPGYPQVWNVASGNAIELLRFKYVSYTVFEPSHLAYTDSAECVAQEKLTDGMIQRVNRRYELDGKPDNWIEVIGGPGSTDANGLLAGSPATNIFDLINCDSLFLIGGANQIGISNLADAEDDREDLLTQWLAWTLPPTSITMIGYYPLTVGGVTAIDWNDSLDTIAAMDGRISVFKGLTEGAGGMGDPQGTNTQNPVYYADAVHLNELGADEASLILFNSGIFDQAALAAGVGAASIALEADAVGVAAQVGAGAAQIEMATVAASAALRAVAGAAALEMTAAATSAVSSIGIGQGSMAVDASAVGVLKFIGAGTASIVVDAVASSVCMRSASGAGFMTINAAGAAAVAADGAGLCEIEITAQAVNGDGGVAGDGAASINCTADGRGRYLTPIVQNSLPEIDWDDTEIADVPQLDWD